MTDKLKVLDLFSGIGSFSLGLERTGGFETVAFCEIEEFPRKVLSKHWPEVPCYEDVRKLKGEDIGPVDVICGGYPCQPFSTAGKRRGEEDDRHLWPEFNRLVAELRPTWVIGENVAGHISMGLDDVLSDLEKQGYACRTFVIPACAVDAPHRRDRVWTVAHRNSECGTSLRRECSHPSGESSFGRNDGDRSDGNAEREKPDGCSGKDSGDVAHATDEGLPIGGQAGREAGDTKEGTGMVTRSERRREVMANTHNTRLQGRQEAGNIEGQRQGRDKLFERCSNGKGSTWPVEPAVGRVANGIPRRVDRLKALGNAVVPQIPEMIGHAILEAME